MADVSSNMIVALIAVAMAFAFWSADRDSPTSRALSLCLALVGMTIFVYAIEKIGVLADVANLWQRVGALCEAGAAAAGYEWILRTGRTNAPRDQRTQLGEGLLRVAQGLVTV
ncbi:MAG: hypothetical protein ACREQJ_12285, partial [Candidatus Binatia bacterium]